MTLPLVSVVIPAYNAAPFIGDALRSVCHQSYPPDHLQIVVVDDGSTDETPAVAKSIVEREQRLFLLLQSPRSFGPSAARNRGWQAARGEWIQFLDADDVISEHKIEKQIRVASGASPEVACVYSRWAKMTHVGAPVAPEDIFDPDLGSDPACAALRSENFVPFAAQLVRRSWLAAVDGFNEEYRLVEDVDLQLRILLAGGVAHHVQTSRPLFWYRRRPDSLSQQDETAFVYACVRNFDMVAEHWHQRGELHQSRVQALVDAYYWAARFFAEHDSEAFEVTIGRIHVLQPDWEPPAPMRLRQLSRLFGYANAERLAVKYRQLKRFTRAART
jgi:glycosyltransferase involved in cell wall biosynthesis